MKDYWKHRPWKTWKSWQNLMASRGVKDDLLPPETIFSYSMYSGSTDCRVCLSDIKGIVTVKERTKGQGWMEKVAKETKALYHFAERNRLRREKRLGKRGRSLEHAIFHLVSRPAPQPDTLRRFFRCRRTVCWWRFQGTVAKDIIAGHWSLLENEKGMISVQAVCTGRKDRSSAGQRILERFLYSRSQGKPSKCEIPDFVRPSIKLTFLKYSNYLR